MLLITIALSYGIISFYDPGNWLTGLDFKLNIFINGLLFLTGIFAISYYLYSKVGMESQAWQEGIKGDKIRDFQRETGSVQVAIGTIPTFTTTIIITVTGMASIVLGSYLDAALHIRIDWFPGVLLLGSGAYLIQRDITVFDRFFYQTHAFYSDFFFSSSPSLESSRTASYSSIYWVPSHWRPSAWAGIVQFDRYIPMGRIIFLGHVVLWLLFLFDAPPFIRESYLFLFVLMQNSSIYILLNPRLGPVSWNYRMQGITNWIITRFFIQIRWILPFILSLLL
ncbi:MAG TPA: hypothetical protein VKA08_11455, partial [Balneolales bacterium]|nr:hypothetical protein [Balneolales bacterium]